MADYTLPSRLLLLSDSPCCPLSHGMDMSPPPVEFVNLMSVCPSLLGSETLCWVTSSGCSLPDFIWVLTPTSGCPSTWTQFLSWLVSDINAGQVSQMNPFFSFLDSSTIVSFSLPVERAALFLMALRIILQERKKKKKRKLDRGYIVFFLSR